MKSVRSGHLSGWRGWAEAAAGVLLLALSVACCSQLAHAQRTPSGSGALPSQSGQSGKFLTTNGSKASWGTVATASTLQAGYNASGAGPVTINESVTGLGLTLYDSFPNLSAPLLNVGNFGGSTTYFQVVGTGFSSTFPGLRIYQHINSWNSNALYLCDDHGQTTSCELGHDTTGSGAVNVHVVNNLTLDGAHGLDRSTSGTFPIGDTNATIMTLGGSQNGQITATTNRVAVVQNAVVGGVTAALSVAMANHTASTAGVEQFAFLVKGSSPQWSTGALTTQRFNLFDQPTINFVGASTVTNAATVDIKGAPLAGTNATLSNAFALRIESGNSQFAGAILFDASDSRAIGALAAPAQTVYSDHLSGGTVTGPAVAVGASAQLGTTPTASLTAGTDTGGTITVTTGTTPTAFAGSNATMATMTFHLSYSTTAPRAILISPANGAAALIQSSAGIHCFANQAGTSTSAWALSCIAPSGSFAASTAYAYSYMVIQ